MHQELRDALEASITKVLSKLTDAPVVEQTELAWRRREPGGNWLGEYQQRPTLSGRWDQDLNWEDEAEVIQRALESHHPDHLNLVGCSTTGHSRLNGRELLRRSIGELWSRDRSFDIAPERIRELIEAVARFIDGTSIRLQYVAPLVNFSADCDKPIELLGCFVIRRLSETEVTRLYGGPLYALHGLSPFIHDWALCGVIEEPKTLGAAGPAASKVLNDLVELLNRVVLALRTFNSGPVGCQAVEFTRADFIPLPMGRITRTFGQEYVPLGTYRLESSDVPGFLDHARYVTSGLHPALEIACSRLAQASIRTDARDCLIDAVVGLEGILLSALGNEDYRGELRFRFALNYAVLEDLPSVRAASFRVARDLYDLRSRIAHGGNVLKDAIRIGGDTLTLQQAAARATEILRIVVKRFLPDSPKLKAGENLFWEEKYFGSTG